MFSKIVKKVCDYRDHAVHVREDFTFGVSGPLFAGRDAYNKAKRIAKELGR